MKKSIFLIFLLVFSVFLLASCTKNQGQNKGAENGFRQPDFGQPERQPDISGLVKSVTGNEVTILKIERPQMSENSDNGIPDNNGSGEQGTASGERPAQLNLGNGTIGGRTPGAGRGFGGGGFAGGNMDENTQAQMLERIKEMSAGEEKVTIPVGIQMLKMERGDASKQPEAVEAALTDVINDKMISIWLDESVTDRKIASFVLINN